MGCILLASPPPLCPMWHSPSSQISAERKRGGESSGEGSADVGEGDGCGLAGGWDGLREMGDSNVAGLILRAIDHAPLTPRGTVSSEQPAVCSGYHACSFAAACEGFGHLTRKGICIKRATTFLPSPSPVHVFPAVRCRWWNETDALHESYEIVESRRRWQ